MLSKHIYIYLYMLPQHNWHSSPVLTFPNFRECKSYPVWPPLGNFVHPHFDQHFKSFFRNDSGTRPPLPKNENRTNRRNHPNI